MHRFVVLATLLLLLACPNRRPAAVDLDATPDLARLVALLEAAEPSDRTEAQTVDAELAALRDADQTDRVPPIDWAVVSVRDAERRTRVSELVAEGRLNTSGDHLAAALIFQHGGDASAYAKAHALAVRAVELAPEDGDARWLAAASLDRWLHALGRPQVFGTQFRKDGDGPWTMEPFDPDALSAAVRDRARVPSLADQEARLQRMRYDDLRARAAAFTLPPPEGDTETVANLWSTHYHLWEATEVAAGATEAYVVLDPDDRPFPPEAPIHLSGRDWCFAALEGSAHVTRLDGTSVTLNYAAQKDVAVPCENYIGSSWRSQGRVRFGFARGPYGDGVRGLRLVPYRTIAVDKNQQTIPYGTAVFIAEAVGDAFEHEGVAYTHDGWFFAADTGGAIRGEHIDTFTGVATTSQLDHVRDSAKAARFTAEQAPGDHPIAKILQELHAPAR